MMLFGLFRKRQVADVVDLSQQSLREIPSSLYEHKRSLQRLYLGRNLLRDFPKGILRFDGLTELDLSDNELLFLPPIIGHLSQLKVLNLSCNNLPCIPDGIQNCEELISLNFSNNPLGRICDGVTQLKQLRHLKLNYCELDTLPRNIGELSKLETLELRDNKLMDLPISFGRLQNLDKLDLGTNEFESLPPDIGGLVSLTEFWIDNNILLSLPEEIGMLSRLVFFEVSENRLIDLPLSFGDLQNLKDLYLNDNLLTQLPSSFGSLHNLQTCKLSINRLQGLPDTLTGLHMLADLDLSNNFIVELPESICSLKSLVSLNIDGNCLEQLPNEIGSCSLLTVLSLRNNKVAVMPKSITQLQNLKVLTIVGNRLSGLPLGVLGIKSLRAIWVAENQIRPMLEFQTQEDSEKGEKWITCVVFPQREQVSYYEDSQVSSGSDLTTVEKNVSPQRHSVSVNFDSEAKENKSSISRDLTPYPKELRNRVKKWRKSRDLVDSEASDDDDLATATVQLRHSTPRKLSRPYSLLKALNNPVQDMNGFNNGLTGSLSPDLDLLMSLPLSEIIEKSNEMSNEEPKENGVNHMDSESTNPQTLPPISNNDSADEIRLSSVSTNGNSNNNTQEPPLALANSASATAPVGEHSPLYQKAPSIISDSSSVVSTKLAKYMKEEGTGTEGSESGHEAVPAWYLSPTPSPYHPLESGSSISVIEKMEMDRDQYMNNDFSPPSHDVTSPPVFISPIYDVHTPLPSSAPVGSIDLASPTTRDSVFSSSGNSHSTDFLQRDSQLAYTSHYQSPLSLSHSVDESHYDYVKPRRCSFESRQREKDLAIEYTLQTELRPEVVCSRTQVDEHIYSHPRSYRGSCSGRNTPDTPRAGFKSMSSLCDSGIESIRRPTPIGGLSRSASTGVGLDSNSFICSPRTYEVTLRKNPTLGMAITGGIDGENAINPKDKGFHVYKLVDGMPASSCGKISVGDKILEVNGVNVSNLTNAQIVRLLTAPEAYTTLLLARQPSMTLL